MTSQHRPRRLAGAFVGCLVLLASASTVRADEGTWPLWPTEVGQIAAPILEPEGVGETSRYTALLRLSAYPTPLIQPAVLKALKDDSAQIQRQALSMCADREMRVCVPAAAELWRSSQDLSLRTRALDVISLDPATPAHLELLLEGLDSDDELMRSHAAGVLSRAPLDTAGLERARAALVARLADQSTRVRADAARALGVLGTGRGAVVLVRLLSDPDPNVREAATEALGLLGDPRSAPALRRNLDRPMTSRLATLTVAALARLPGEEIDELLLSLLDSQPTGLSRSSVADAIASRESPSDALIDGLVSRLRDNDLRREVLDALLDLGDRARPALLSALERGLEPDLAADVQLLVDASAPADAEVDGTPIVRSDAPLDLPPASERGQWRHLLHRRQPATRSFYVAALRDLDPDWGIPAAMAELDRASGPRSVRGSLELLAIADDERVDLDAHPIVEAKLQRWAMDAGMPNTERCLAALALARPARRRRPRASAAALLASPSDDVRACTALGLARRADPRSIEAALRDPSARVRATAALGLAGRALPRRVRSLLEVLVRADPDPDVRALIRWSLDAGDEVAPFQLVHASDGAPARPRWLDLAPGGTGAALRVPAFGVRRLTIVPVRDPRTTEAPAPVEERGGQPFVF